MKKCSPSRKEDTFREWESPDRDAVDSFSEVTNSDEQADNTNNDEQSDITESYEQPDITNEDEHLVPTISGEQADNTNDDEQPDNTDNNEQSNLTISGELPDHTTDDEQPDLTDNNDQRHIQDESDSNMAQEVAALNDDEANSILRQIEEEIAHANYRHGQMGSDMFQDTLDSLASSSNMEDLDLIRTGLQEDCLNSIPANNVNAGFAVNVQMDGATADQLFSGPVYSGLGSEYSVNELASLSFDNGQLTVSDSSYFPTPNVDANRFVTPRIIPDSSIKEETVSVVDSIQPTSVSNGCCPSCGTKKVDALVFNDSGCQTDSPPVADVAVQTDLDSYLIQGEFKKIKEYVPTSSQIELSKSIIASKSTVEMPRELTDVEAKQLNEAADLFPRPPLLPPPSPLLPPPSLVTVPVLPTSVKAPQLPFPSLSTSNVGSSFSFSSDCPSMPGSSLCSLSPPANVASPVAAKDNAVFRIAATVNSISESTNANSIWLQCDNCDKWRLLPTEDAPTPLPDTWTCKSMTSALSDPCSLPEDIGTDEDPTLAGVDDSEWVVVTQREGDVVYAKMRGYPFWPAIIECPAAPAEVKGDGSYFFKNSVDEIEYHVTFFDSPPTTTWVKEENLFTFPAPQSKIDAVNKRALRAKSSLLVRFKVGERLAADAVKLAQVKTRLDNFGLRGLNNQMEMINGGTRKKKGSRKRSKSANKEAVKRVRSQAIVVGEHDQSRESNASLRSEDFEKPLWIGASSRLRSRAIHPCDRSTRSCASLAYTESETDVSTASSLVTSTPRPGTGDLACRNVWKRKLGDELIKVRGLL